MIINNVNPDKLHGELIDKGIRPEIVEHDLRDDEITANNTWITFQEKTDLELVRRVLDEHDPTPPPEPLSEIDKLKVSQAEQFEAILSLLGGI